MRPAEPATWLGATVVHRLLIDAEMKATQLLKQQHREVEKIFQAIESGQGDLMESVEKLADALVAHSAIELQLFYPAVQKIDSDLIMESFEEHAVVEVGLERLLAVDPTHPSFKAKMTVLKELIEHHLDEEEKELFPKVEKSMSGDELEALGTDMETMFNEVMEEGHEATLSKKVPKTTADEAVARSLDLKKLNGGRASTPSLA